MVAQIPIAIGTRRRTEGHGGAVRGKKNGEIFHLRNTKERYHCYLYMLLPYFTAIPD
jgi:hypothetical protein